MCISTPITILIVLIGLGDTLGNRLQDKWVAADKKIARLAPEKFRQLPHAIVTYLQKRKCRIPQTWHQSTPHNVIKGMFTKQGNSDWAMLCSDGKSSSILIFPNGATTSVLEIAKSEDRTYLQTVDGKGTIGYSRAISVADKDYIIGHYKGYGGPKPPSINHHGINDAFLEKASVVHYYHRGAWLKLQGAD